MGLRICLVVCYLFLGHTPFIIINQVDTDSNENTKTKTLVCFHFFLTKLYPILYAGVTLPFSAISDLTSSTCMITLRSDILFLNDKTDGA